MYCLLLQKIGRECQRRRFSLPRQGQVAWIARKAAMPQGLTSVERGDHVFRPQQGSVQPIHAEIKPVGIARKRIIDPQYGALKEVFQSILCGERAVRQGKAKAQRKTRTATRRTSSYAGA